MHWGRGELQNANQFSPPLPSARRWKVAAGLHDDDDVVLKDADITVTKKMTSDKPQPSAIPHPPQPTFYGNGGERKNR
eukprot:scaffold248551_cov50-Cyclotella_meneghiniana.AAC.1